MITVIIIIVLAWALASFMDAVAFGKVYGEDLYEVWHIAKGLLFAILFAYILYLNHAAWYWYVGAPVWLRIQHEFLYAYLRYLEVYRLDNKYRVKFLKWLWR